MNEQEQLFKYEKSVRRNGGSFYFLITIVLILLVLPFLFLAQREPVGAVLGVSSEANIEVFDKSIEKTHSAISFPKSNERPLDPIAPKNISKIDFEIEQGSFAVYDCASDTLISGKKQNEERSIASISKLFTAVVFLDEEPDLKAYYKVKQDDIINEGVQNIFVGQEIRIMDLLGASLVGSDNSATRALVSALNLSEADFVKKMNKRVRELGLKKTSFYDVVGLSRFNRSTAAEVAQFTKIALNYSEIKKLAGKPTYSFTTRDGDKDKTVHTTNTLLTNQKKSEIKSMGGKTGFTNEAGYCFTGKFRDTEKDIIVTVLGDSDKNARFYHATEIADFVFKNFAW